MAGTIGKYRILDRLGRGGMGTVFRAHDPTLGRLVAVKVISADIDVTDELKARFYREAQACARLSHPNIITVHELGDDDGRLFIVMELLDGEDLKRIIARRPDLGLEDKLSMMIQICDGLSYAHQKGVIHRDVKPGNIVVLGDGQVKILDFGIARVVTDDSALTNTGRILGTLRYMSPEQARGRVDHRSDIFSAGTVFYELLTYRRAFDAEDPMELLELLRAENPRPVAEIDPTIPRELSETIERAMRKHPAERFADLDEMRARLDRVRRSMAAEADRLRTSVHPRLDEARRLRTALAERLGTVQDAEALPPLGDRTGLTTLKRIERELPGEIGRLQAQLARANDLDPVLAQGVASLERDDPERALAGFERVLREMPDHRRAEEGLLRLCERLESAGGDPGAAALLARARAALGRAAARRVAQAAFAEAEARLAAGDLAEAIERFTEALGADGTHAEVAAALDRARAALAEREARDAEIARRLSAVEEALAGQDPQAAKQAIDRLAELAPDLPQFALLRLRAKRERERSNLEASEPPREPTRARTRWFRRLVVVGAAAMLLLMVGTIVVRRAELPWLPGSSERAAAEHSRRAVLKARDEAMKADPERLFPALWVLALERERTAESGLTRGEFADAGARFDEARESYARISKEAGALAALSQRETTARRVEGLAVNARQTAELAEADKFAPRSWASAIDKQRQAESALRAEDFHRAQSLWSEAEEAYRLAERETRQRQTAVSKEERDRQEVEARARQTAQELGEAASAARREAAQTDAGQFASALLAAAQQKEQEARQLVERRDYSRAAKLFLEAQAGYRRAGSEAQRLAAVERDRSPAEQARTQMVQAREAAEKADARRLVGPLVAAGEMKDREGQAAFGRQEYPRARQLFQDAQADYQRAAEEAKQVAAIEGDNARAEQARAQMAQARGQAEQAGARRLAGSFFPAAETKEKDGQAAFGRQEYPRAQQLFQEAQGEYQKAATEAKRIAALPKPPPPPSDPQAEIREVLEDYKHAMESKDLALLQRVRPGLSVIEARQVRAAFGNMRQHRIDLEIQDIAVSGDVATVKGRRRDSLESVSGHVFRNEALFAYQLRRTPDRWVIDSLR